MNAIDLSHDENSCSAFGRTARLHNRWQLDEMKTAGRKGVGRFCVVIADKTPSDQSRRAAFLISRKYSLLAVERNRARRLFRETFRIIFDSLPPAVWILFVPRQRMKTAKLEQVLEDVTQLGRQLGILPGASEKTC